MKFKSNLEILFGERTRFHSNSGERVKTSYKLLTDKRGVKDLTKSGKINLYEEIQSHKDSADIHVVLQRFANGDESVLTHKKAMYGDFTLIPQDIHTLNDRLFEAEFIFNSLPATERAKFNHSASQFFASLGTEKFNAWANDYFNAEKDVNVHLETDSTLEPKVESISDSKVDLLNGGAANE